MQQGYYMVQKYKIGDWFKTKFTFCALYECVDIEIENNEYIYFLHRYWPKCTGQPCSCTSDWIEENYKIDKTARILYGTRPR